MKKLFSTITGIFLIFAMVSPTYAVGPSIKHVTGAVKYTAGSSVQRHASFNMANFNNTCSYDWNITNAYVIAFQLDGDPTQYPHDANLTQTGSSVTGFGGYPVAGPYAYEWDVTSGEVNGTDITLNVLYDVGAPGTVMTMTGAIADDGSMSGAWTDDFGGTRTGTWTTTSGAAVKTPGGGCEGSGIFNYIDASKKHYLVDVKYINISGNKVWFAGPVRLGNIGAGQWLFAKAEDVVNPQGANQDRIWGSFTTEAAAILGVATMTDPADGPFVISSGNVKVH